MFCIMIYIYKISLFSTPLTVNLQCANAVLSLDGELESQEKIYTITILNLGRFDKLAGVISRLRKCCCG